MQSASTYLFAFALLLPLASYGAKPATPVYVTEVQPQSFIEEIEALGTLSANENVELASTVTARVIQVNFNDGQRVKKGDLLIAMDASEEQQNLNEERFIQRKAQLQVDRLKPLVARGATSQSTMDEAALDLKIAQARIAAIDSQISKHKILAPFDGKLGLRNISVGSLVQPGSLITTIDDDTKMKLDFSIPEVYISSLNDGGSIIATAKAWPGEQFAGVVASLDSRVDAVTRTISVRGLLDNPDFKLKPGMLMQVKLQKEPRTTLLIPVESVLSRGAKNYVYRVDNNNGKMVSVLQEVTLGAQQIRTVEILNGVSPGDLIVTHGIVRLQNGSAVVVKAADEGNTSLQDLLSQSQSSVQQTQPKP